jgi:16S rRNA G1207 methylase RsmC
MSGRRSSPIRAELLGRRFEFRSAPGLFSADRVDDGTRLLLDHLPERPPRTFLDLGCGYGALGLPVAAAHPDARGELVDRDLLAVEVAAENARQHRIVNVSTRGSLGCRDLPGRRWDWALCNLPARIGKAAAAHLLGDAAARLEPGGEVRVVVIRDLAPTIEAIAAERGWASRRVARGGRHDVFAIGPAAGGAPEDDVEAVYGRDEVILPGGRRLLRPHDINEDPEHRAVGLPLLLDCLPRRPRGSALCLRLGYGAVEIELAARGARVVSADRDLLASAFVQCNARRAEVVVEVRTAARPEEAVGADERFGLVVGEEVTPEGPEASAARIAASGDRLAPGGEGLWLVRERLRTDVAGTAAVLARREPYAVVRFATPTARR